MYAPPAVHSKLSLKPPFPLSSSPRLKPKSLGISISAFQFPSSTLALLITAFGVASGGDNCQAALPSVFLHFKSHISHLRPTFVRYSSNSPPLRQYKSVLSPPPPPSCIFLHLYPLPFSHLSPYFHSHWLSYKCKGSCSRSFFHLHPTTTKFALLVSSTNNLLLCLFTQQSNSFKMKFLKLSSVVLALPFAIANPVKNVDFAHGQPSDGKLKGGPILGKS